MAKRIPRRKPQWAWSERHDGEVNGQVNRARKTRRSGRGRMVVLLWGGGMELSLLIWAWHDAVADSATTDGEECKTLNQALGHIVMIIDIPLDPRPVQLPRLAR